MNKYDIKYIIKKVILAVIIGLIYTFINRLDTFALSAPTHMCYATVEKGFVCDNNIISQTWFGSNNIWTTNDFKYSFIGSSDYLPYGASVYWNNANWCPNEGMVISGHLIAGNNLFDELNLESNLQVTISNDTKTYTCLTRTKNALDVYYECSVVNGAGSLNLSFIYKNMPLKTAQLGLLRDIQVSCNPNNASIINNQNQNTQTIINNNNSNTQQIIDSQNNINNNITNPNIDTGGGAGHYFGDNEFKKEYGLSDFVLIPIHFIQDINGNVCNNIEVPLPFTDESFILPCMRAILLDKFPDFISLYQTIISGVIVFKCLMGCYSDIYKAMDPDERLEVTDMFA